MSSEVEKRATFSLIRYAQCWEDADILLEGLKIAPGDTCLGIASAGDNCLAMLLADPKRVIAVDLNPLQLHCLELRVAAYRCLDHAGLLELIGSRASNRRTDLYQQCRGQMSVAARDFWDAEPSLIAAGIGAAGKFERYFQSFRTRVLPLVHSRRTVEALLQGGEPSVRQVFYQKHWNTWRWRLLFRLFFSRFVMGRMGRDPAFFRYVEGSVADRILARAKHALVELNPAENPYLHWILCGNHGSALPLALRPENFDIIRQRLDRLEWRCSALEDVLTDLGPGSIDRFNLSDIFEYMSQDAYHSLLERILVASRPGARLLYWNMLTPRSRPLEMADRLEHLETLGAELLTQDKAFFYSAVVVEAVR